MNAVRIKPSLKILLRIIMFPTVFLFVTTSFSIFILDRSLNYTGPVIVSCSMALLISFFCIPTLFESIRIDKAKLIISGMILTKEIPVSEIVKISKSRLSMRHGANLVIQSDSELIKIPYKKYSETDISGLVRILVEINRNIEVGLFS